MSELIHTRHNLQNIRWQLLTTASAVALICYGSEVNPAKAEDAGHPTIWIELGGQMESMQGTSSPFIAPFMTLTPTPAPYNGNALTQTQRPPGRSFGLEGKIVFQPEDSDWLFSAAVRYGRSNTKRHFHQQSPAIPSKYVAPYADVKTSYSGSHTVLDFSAGRDVGVGTFGQGGVSTINAGIRFAQFTAHSSVGINARPEIEVQPYAYYSLVFDVVDFADYHLSARSARNFRGIGPTLSWDASAILLGSADDGSVQLDWGANVALLFGRQSAKTYHGTQAEYRPPVALPQYFDTQLYPLQTHHSTRSRSVVIPNVGGFAGISVQKANAKLSLGYRADFFFGAVDAGIDVRRTKNLGFHGPFATISIGLGG